MNPRATATNDIRIDEVVFIKLTGPNRSQDMATLVGSGTIVGGPQPGVFGVTSANQLETLRKQGVAFEEIGRATR